MKSVFDPKEQDRLVRRAYTMVLATCTCNATRMLCYPSPGSRSRVNTLFHSGHAANAAGCDFIRCHVTLHFKHAAAGLNRNNLLIALFPPETQICHLKLKPYADASIHHSRLSLSNLQRSENEQKKDRIILPAPEVLTPRSALP